MALEAAAYVNALVSANPPSGDPVTQADDHLRLIKAALIATFPNLNAPVTKTPVQLNNTVDKTGDTMTGPLVLSADPTAPLQPATKGYVDSLAASLNAALAVAVLPSSIILWYGSPASVPAGYHICDGTNGTPDLRNRFVVGAGAAYGFGATGGTPDATLVSHSHTASSAVSDPGHFHQWQYAGMNGTSPGSGSYAGGTGGTIPTDTRTTGITVSTSVDAAGGSAIGANMPPYMALCYIMKLP